ncbi:MAG: hypothetical protein AAF441_20760 [Pseudomonadota bacterium]
MKITEVTVLAEQLLAAHGDNAEAEAAQRATIADRAGNTGEAEQWRQVRTAVHALRGPHAS